MTVAYERIIADIVETVFATMLNLKLYGAAETSSAEADTLLATVHLSGAWTGSVVLELPSDVSRAVAAAMLQLAPAEVADADRVDVAAELANMIGGNLKRLLPGPSFLSLPTVVSGRDVGLSVHAATLLEHVALTSAAGPVQVRLYERTNDGGDHGGR